MAETPTYDTYPAGHSVLTGDNRVKMMCLTGPQVAEWFDISAATWRGWVSKGLAPKADTNIGGNKQIPVWTLETLGEYLRSAPGGRLGYPVG